MMRTCHVAARPSRRCTVAMLFHVIAFASVFVVAGSIGVEGGGTGDEVSTTAEAAELRSYNLRQKKRKGLLRRETSLAKILFPGASPESYEEGEEVTMFVEPVESKKTQVPFNYYKLPTCRRAKGAEKKRRTRKNLGMRLMGHSSLPVPYAVHAKKKVGCTVLCHLAIPANPLRWMRRLVKDQYRVHFTLDSLPVLMRSNALNYAVRGYPLGFIAPPSYTGLAQDETYLFNHLKFSVSFREAPQEFDGIRIIAFDVHPVSIKHTLSPGSSFSDDEFKLDTCNADAPPGSVLNDPNTYLPLRSETSGEPFDLVYTYEVDWIPTSNTWSDRWDVYLVGAPDDSIHIFAIVNSLMIVLFLMGSVATILIRTLRRDIAGYNDATSSFDDAGGHEETGWKLVHGDVFRPPIRGRMLLSVATGTGMQIGTSVFLAMICAIFKLLNPMKKGQTLTGILVLYVLSGSVGGYTSARLYKFCEGTSWKRNTMLTAMALPGVLVGMFTCLNVFLAFAGAATSVSIWTLLTLFLLWVCVSTPLIFVGSYFGFKAVKWEVPTKTNQIARFIPERAFYSVLPWSALLGGILPFGSVCIELFFIMGALWLHQIYYVMGFVLVVLMILTATCSMVSMVMCYLQLCGEDHQWWWKSFLNTASAGFYLFLYALWFLMSRLQLVGMLPVAVYLTYMSMISVGFGLYCGAVGLLSGFWFTRKIYGAVKVD